MRPSTADWTPQRPWEEQRPWGWGRVVDVGRLRRAIWLDCHTLGSTQFVVLPPNATDSSRNRLVNFHPRRPLDAPPCECDDWRAGNLCVHVLCVLLNVGDREIVQALRQLVRSGEAG